MNVNAGPKWKERQRNDGVRVRTHGHRGDAAVRVRRVVRVIGRVHVTDDAVHAAVVVTGKPEQRKVFLVQTLSRSQFNQ